MLGLALGLGGVVGCAHGTENLVRSGMAGGVGGSLEALNDPLNKQLLLNLLEDPDIQRAAHDLTAAHTGGAIDGLSDAQRMLRVREASDAYVRTVAAAVGKALDEDISPAVTRAVNDIVGGAVAGALRPANIRRAQELVDGVTRTTIAAFTQSTAAGLRDDLGPALNKDLAEDLGPAQQQVVENNLGPALRKVLDKDLGPAMTAMLDGEDGGVTGAFVRALTKQIVLGVNDGMSELGISPSPNAKDGGAGLSWWLIVLGVLSGLLLLLLLRMYFMRQAHLRDRARNEEMLVNILRAVQSPDSGVAPSAGLEAVIARVRQHMPELDNDNSYLATIVGRSQLPSRPVRAARPGPKTTA
jgi:hypothetical protein